MFLNMRPRRCSALEMGFASVYSEPVLIYGRNPVLEALRGGQVERLFAARGIEPRFARELEDEAEKAGLELEWVARIEMDQVVQTTHHQGIVAEIADTDWKDLEDAFTLAESRNEQILLVLLDGITDPHNFGAIIRSAEVLGAHGVVVEERRSAPLSPTVVKTAAGATSYLPIAQVKNLPRLIDDLKERGVWVYGAAGESKDTLESLDCDRPLALVIGSEGDGLRRLVREKCDALAAIPTRGRVQSLNASVAAAILIYQALSGRK
jgi:23S rRNA (guanosine2251-2'-O)-methyltransferase